MEQLFKNLSKKQKIGFATILLIILALIVVGIVMMAQNKEPIAKIQNIDEYMMSVSKDDKIHLQKSLYSFLDERFDVDIEKLDIYIRDNTFAGMQADELYSMNFIIDIDELKSSYYVSYITPSTGATSVNPVFDCPAVSEMKYPETECVGMYNSSAETRLEADNPIYAVLPISVDAYDYGSKQSVKYDIFGITDNDNNKFTVRIIDYGGYAYEHALNTIREKGFNPEDYTIEYISYGGE